MGSYYLDGREIKVTIQDGATINASITAVGAKGEQGDIGETGATGATGTSLRNLGTWSSATAYVNNASYTDLVYYNGSYYACKVSNTNQVPTNTTYWDLIVSKGDTGATGPSGVGFTETGYYPVDYNGFRVTSDTAATTGLTIPLTKISGGLSIASNIITLPKGYSYEVNVDFDFGVAGATGEASIDITDTSNNSKIWRYNHPVSVYLTSAASGSTGYGIIDLTSASSDLNIKAYVRASTNNPTLSASFGGLYITKHKKVTI